MKKEFNYGGQAVIEGVMMRGPKDVAIACRRPNNEIIVEQRPINSITKRFPFLKWPLFRGVVMLVESLVIGMQALTFSANQATEEEDEELGGWAMFVTIAVALGLGVALFIVAPAALARFINAQLGDNIIALNLIEGSFRITIFLGYIFFIARMKDIQRVFQYHGAEHKTIHAYEAGEDLNIENVQKHVTLHPRCGTSFLLIVMVVSIFVFAFLGKQPLWLRIISKISLMPVVAGISYEFTKFTSKYTHVPFCKLLLAPGLGLQKLTTREPDDHQVEVAIHALRAVLDKEAREEGADLK